jgi:hypothetical protein
MTAQSRLLRVGRGPLGLNIEIPQKIELNHTARRHYGDLEDEVWRHLR